MSKGIYKHKKGIYKHSENTKRKIGISNSISQKGKKLSIETKKKMSEFWKGKKKLPFTKEHKEKISKAKKGKDTWMKGKRHTLQTKKKMSLSHKGIPAPYRAREKCHFWKGGITDLNRYIKTSLDYRLWREAVFKRDNYTCIWCGEKGKKLQADHIKPFSLYPELRFAIDNGRTLCINCHRKTNSYSGRMNRFRTKEEDKSQ